MKTVEVVVRMTLPDDEALDAPQNFAILYANHGGRAVAAEVYPQGDKPAPDRAINGFLLWCQEEGKAATLIEAIEVSRHAALEHVPSAAEWVHEQLVPESAERMQRSLLADKLYKLASYYGLYCPLHEIPEN